MGQRKTNQNRVLPGFFKAPVQSAKASARMLQWAVYSTSPKFPGKLVQRLPDGTEVVGTFQNGAFVPEQTH